MRRQVGERLRLKVTPRGGSRSTRVLDKQEAHIEQLLREVAKERVSVLVVDEPVGPTSFAVLRRVRRALMRAPGISARPPRATAEPWIPMASGTTPVCVGEATSRSFPFCFMLTRNTWLP